MDEKFDTKTVLTAYQRLSTAKDNTEVKKIDKYLKAFERSRDAWAISQEILMSQIKEDYALLQSARVLKSKIEFDFAQLPQQDYSNQLSLIVSNITILFSFITSHIILSSYQNTR